MNSNTKSTSSTGKVLWKLALIIIHYVNLITDYMVVVTFFQQGSYFYFTILLISYFGSWCSVGVAYVFDPMGSPPMWSWLTQLDYIYLQFYQDEYDPDGDCVTTKKVAMLTCQTIPSIFITVYSIYTENVHDPIYFLSVAASVIDLSLTNALLLLFGMKMIDSTLAKKRAGEILALTSFLLLENCMKLLLWGFAVYLCRPWGVWTFIPAIAVVTTLLLWKDGLLLIDYFIEILLNIGFYAGFIGRVEIPISRELKTSKYRDSLKLPIFYSKTLEICLYLLIFVVYQNDLNQMLTD